VSGPPGNPRYVLFVLFLVGVFNLADRQVLAILVEPIKRDLGATDAAMGLLIGFGFVFFYAFAGLPLARWSDSRSRRDVVTVALAFWSLLTAASGLATSFVQLALLRLGVGAGEAATGPASHSMLSDLFPEERRTAAISVLTASTPLGIMVAFVAGGLLEEAAGWRTTLVAMGLPGMGLALLIHLTVREPPRGGAEGQGTDLARYGLADTARHLWRRPAFRYLIVGASASAFAGTAGLAWAPAFLMRVHGLGPAEAGAWLGLAAGLSGVAGTLLTGLLTERLARRHAGWMLGSPAATSLLAVPFLLLFLTLEDARGAARTLFGFLFFGPAMLGPVLTLAQNLARVRMRATAAALVYLALNLVGAAGALAVGVASDRLAPRFAGESLRYALGLAVAALLAAALSFGLGARRLPEAEVSEPSPPPG
jgi:predicted MFS family arabinose efflux permease